MSGEHPKSKTKMNNTTKFLLVLVVAAGLVFAYQWTRPVSEPLKLLSGITSGEPYIGSANATVACPGATSTVVATSSQSGYTRLYFAIVASGTAPITLCKASTCVSGSGIILSGSGGAYEQEPTDNYQGVYSCIGNGATSSAGFTVKQ